MALTIPLEFLAPIAVFGVVGVVLLAHVTGRTARPKIEDPPARWLHLHAHDEVVEHIVGGDERTALVWLGDGVAGVLVAVGDKVAARRIGPGVLRRVEDRQGGLVLRLRDPGMSKIRISLPDEGRALWAQRLRATIEGGS